MVAVRASKRKRERSPASASSTGVRAPPRKSPKTTLRAEAVPIDSRLVDCQTAETRTLRDSPRRNPPRAVAAANLRTPPPASRLQSACDSLPSTTSTLPSQGTSASSSKSQTINSTSSALTLTKIPKSAATLQSPACTFEGSVSRSLHAPLRRQVQYAEQLVSPPTKPASRSFATSEAHSRVRQRPSPSDRTPFRLEDLPAELRASVYDHIFYEQRYALRERVGSSYASSSGNKHSCGDPYTAVIIPFAFGSPMQARNSGETFRVMDKSGMLVTSKEVADEYRKSVQVTIWSSDTEFFCLIRNFNLNPVSQFLSSLEPWQIKHINEWRGKHANFTLVLGFTQEWELDKQPWELEPDWKKPEKWDVQEDHLRLSQWNRYQDSQQTKIPRETVLVSEGLPAPLDTGLLKLDFGQWKETRHLIDPDEEHESDFDFHEYFNRKLASFDGYVEVDYSVDLKLEPEPERVEEMLCKMETDEENDGAHHSDREDNHADGGCDHDEIIDTFRQWLAAPSKVHL